MFCVHANRSFVHSPTHSFIQSVSQLAIESVRGQLHSVPSGGANHSSGPLEQDLAGLTSFEFEFYFYIPIFSSPIHALLLVGVEIVVQIRVGATPLLIPGDFEWIGRKSINK